MIKVKAKSKYLRLSPRKARLIVNEVKGLSVSECMLALSHLPHKGASFALDVLKSAVSNAKNNLNISEDRLFIEDFQVEEGPRLKRMDKSHGARFDRGIIQKRMCHIGVELGVREKEEDKKVERKKNGKKS